MLMDHGVAEAPVAGIPHPEKEGQEALKAWIVLNRPQRDRAGIIDFCRRLARMPCPGGWRSLRRAAHGGWQDPAPSW